MNKIVAGIDGSQAALAVCSAAAWASQQLETPVLALHVLDKSEFPTERDLSGNLGLGAQEHLLEELAELDNQRSKLALQQGKLQLKAAREQLEADDAFAVETLQRHGSLTDTIQELEEDTRLVIVGRKGETHANDLHTVGSHLENVIRVARKPLLVTVHEFQKPRNFMLAFDNSKTAKAALTRVAESPLLKGLPCHLVMVGDDTSERRSQLEAAQQELENAGFAVTGSVQPGEPVATVLVNYARSEQIDLTVMGTHGHSRIRKFFVGSNTSELLRQTDTATLVLR